MNYDRWPRSVRIAWFCTLPLGPALMMVGTMLGLPMFYLAIRKFM